MVHWGAGGTPGHGAEATPRPSHLLCCWLPQSAAAVVLLALQANELLPVDVLAGGCTWLAVTLPPPTACCS